MKKRHGNPFEIVLEGMMRRQQFYSKFTEAHPECKGCEHIDLATQESYNIIKSGECQKCSCYKGW